MSTQNTTISYDGQTLTLDAVVTEMDTLTNTITEHEVERGASVVDHVKAKARTISIDGMFTGAPFLDADSLPLSTDAAQFQLEWLHANAVLVTVTTPRKSYPNMVLETLVLPRSRDTGDSLRFSGTLRQVRFAKLKETYVRVVAVPKAKPKIEQGTKPVAEVTNPPPADAPAGSPLDVGGLGAGIRRQRERLEARNRRGTP